MQAAGELGADAPHTSSYLISLSPNDSIPAHGCWLADAAPPTRVALQGDAEDRLKLRKKAEEDAKRKAQEERQDMVLDEAEALARMVSFVHAL